ncbi:hypothetical protein [Metabacillus fastidiosus]|uniref:hypothetical protein n=1 Tax=Metabacillus fastidiosus TaxID=1458 RepID=UPI002DBC8BC4|nr:hypothetical protein [Metabacillus fastidiosus]MEC2077200.1 hypothetical protein [Metabacillus fastidiosus]
MKKAPNRIGSLDKRQLHRPGLLEVIENKLSKYDFTTSFMLYENFEQAFKQSSLTVVS